MKALRLILALVIFATAPCSCKKHYKIEDRAKKQIDISLPSEVKDLVPEIDEVTISDLETVYVNDSICLLQLVARYGINGIMEYEEDLQYVYYLDMMVSRAAGRNVFVEEFRRVPRLSKEEIKAGYKKVKRTKENVYNQYIGNGCPVRKPFDE